MIILEFAKQRRMKGGIEEFGEQKEILAIKTSRNENISRQFKRQKWKFRNI